MSTTTVEKPIVHGKRETHKNGVSEQISASEEGGLLKRRILIVEDEEVDREQLQQLLEADTDLQIDSTGSAKTALQYLSERNYSIVLTDLRMAGLDGMDLIREIQQRGLPVTVIVMTGDSSIHEAVEAIRLGAYDFLLKPIDLDYLRLVMKRALRERRLLDQVRNLRAQLQANYSFHNILSKNPRMHALFELIANVADSNSTVLIEGETGTGKEQVARAIHSTSSRREAPLVAVNCAALPEGLLESELFGHEKGSFTSAVGQRRGRFEMANGGTLFLDEVGDVPAPMQAKLLRVLQERRFERVGGTETIEVDVRVIAATNRSLQQLVKEGKFREDLFYRFNVVKIDLPPLRARTEDIPILVTHFIEKYTRPGEMPKQLDPDAMDILMSYQWPGNIRQLENSMERACITTRGQSIQIQNLPSEILCPPGPSLPFEISLERPLPELVKNIVASVEQEYLRKALVKTQGNVSRGARVCGLSRRCMTAKMAEYKLDKAVFKEV
ncbi:MAG TPA: sigma-54 dependent transcriptional regulator [Gemmataceae bacterium]|nr:sigma-54 dependent transcriptional regulator [Gemmataceae bacterium]